ncbi:MAG TPA: hypothetical protein VKA60_03820 [Blastocatellia bacterium]|nr:hypothetical protein [Blastocatellia bacterium]
MVHTDSIPPEALARIADQIGIGITGLLDPEQLDDLHIELAESFQLWMIGAAPVQHFWQKSQDLFNCVQPTSRWHHQIKFNGEAAAFARSSPPDKDSEQWLLCELFVSSLAKRIEKGIAKIDQRETEFKNNPVVRLLVAPAYQLYAFWLLDEIEMASRVMVIDCPKEFGKLKTYNFFNSSEFLAALPRHHIVGVSYQP